MQGARAFYFCGCKKWSREESNARERTIVGCDERSIRQWASCQDGMTSERVGLRRERQEPRP